MTPRTHRDLAGALVDGTSGASSGGDRARTRMTAADGLADAGDATDTRTDGPTEGPAGGSTDQQTDGVVAGAVDTLIDDGLAADLAAASLSLARRFAAGATLWCVAPGWEPHAQHVAVEFVHPVIVGKRALPAVALTGPDLVAQARVAVRPGDVILAVAGASEAAVASLMRRAPAWGATTLWIGNGERPPAGAADHVLWPADPDPRMPATGRFVLLYHLLWELTHVCFEHPGLLAPGDAECTGEVCVTCGDEGRIGEVIAARGAADFGALVRTATGEERVDTTLVDPVAAGDLILVHAGAAITRLDEDGAR